MSCFWDGLRKVFNPKVNNSDFITYLKNKSTTTMINIIWQGEKLSEQLIKSNREHIKDFDIKSVNKGYDCSSCDPFLILVAQIYECTIHLDYNKHQVVYLNPKFPKTIKKFGNNRGHFWTK
jgi:hypothetical protein